MSRWHSLCLLCLTLRWRLVKCGASALLICTPALAVLLQAMAVQPGGSSMCASCSWRQQLLSIVLRNVQHAKQSLLSVKLMTYLSKLCGVRAHMQVLDAAVKLVLQRSSLQAAQMLRCSSTQFCQRGRMLMHFVWSARDPAAVTQICYEQAEFQLQHCHPLNASLWSHEKSFKRTSLTPTSLYQASRLCIVYEPDSFCMVAFAAVEREFALYSSLERTLQRKLD